MRHLRRLRIRYARWDLSTVDTVDPRDRTLVLSTLYPQDKAKNAEGLRRRLISLDETASAASAPSEAEPSGLAPLLRKLMADYAATGLPPAYLADHRGGGGADAVVQPEPENKEIER